MQDAHLSCVIKQTLNEDDSWNEHVLFIQLWKSIAGDIKLPEKWWSLWKSPENEATKNR